MAQSKARADLAEEVATLQSHLGAALSALNTIAALLTTEGGEER